LGAAQFTFEVARGLGLALPLSSPDQRSTGRTYPARAHRPEKTSTSSRWFRNVGAGGA